MAARKDLTRQIRNAERRLKRLKEKRAYGDEAQEALLYAPLAQCAMECVEYLDKRIWEEDALIGRLAARRARLG